MTSQVSFPRFYREHGVRFITHLKTPRLMDYNQLVLPRESIIHWVDYEGKWKVGPPQEEPLLVQKDNRLFVEAISNYPDETMKQGWMVVRSNVTGFVIQYDSENPNIKRMTKMVNEYVSNEVTPLYAYGLLHTVYRYKRYIDSEVNRWHNYHYTVFETALNVAKLSDRNQFIELQVPRSFPSFQSLKKGETGIDKTNIRYMPSPDHWLVVAMWNLISDNEGNFIFKNYTIADFKKINIIWRIESKYMLTNMAVLLGFANGEEAMIKPAKLRKMLIRAFIGMHTGATADSDDKREIDSGIDEFAGVRDEETEEDYIEDEEPEEDMVDEYDDDAVVTNPFANNSFVKKDKLQQAQQSQNPDTVEEVVLDDDDGAEEDEDEDDDDFLKTLSVVADDESTAVDGYKPYVPKKVTGLSVIEDEGSKLVKAGVMSVGSFERLKRLSEASADIADPLNPRLNIGESSKITKEDITIEDKTPLMVVTNDLQDESMQYSSLNKYSKQYIENVHHKDVLNSVMAIQKGGVIVKDYSIEPVESVNDKYNIHKVQIETIKGHVSTLSFKVPVIESDGTFKCSGSRRFLRKQRGDVPIRKVDYNSVALTSYYSKMFVTRSDRKQFDVGNYITNHIVASTLDSKWHITDIKFGDSFDGKQTLPRIYTTLAKKFISFVCRGHTLYFNINSIDDNFTDSLKRKGIIPLGKDIKTGKTTLYLTKDENPTLLDSEGKSINMSLEEYIGINVNDLPLEYAEVNIFGKNIPLVLILGHHLGFGNLLKTLDLKPRREARNKRLQLEKGEYAIKFKDEVLIFNRFHDLKANLIINGLARFKNTLNGLSVYDLDNKSIYNDLFDEIKAPPKLLKESKDMFNLWVDPITESILVDMSEPTDLVLLFIRAAELLILDEHPDGMDIAFMRDKGYERIAGMIYSELVKATREYNTRSLYNNNKLTINPESIWFTIITDQTVALVEDSNPIHNLKEAEIVIYSGAGGRSGQTMTAATRKFHKSNIGVTGEATVDSGDAGTIIYNVADPNYSSVYGLSKRVEDVHAVGGAKLVSTSTLLAPGGEHDDPKRLNFTSTQNSQSTYITHSTPMPLRTGMEKMVHARAGNMFSKVAKGSGKVIDVSKNAMVVEYEDGTKEGFNIGRVFGRWGGHHIPHELTANVSKGQTFKEGDCLYYNSHYFTPDSTDNNNIMYKNHVLARIALVENYDVYEDSAAMSKEFSVKMTSGLTHIRNIRLTSANTVKGLVKEGDEVTTDSILCTIHSAQLNDGYFSEDTISSLQSISSLNPKAKYRGVVEKVNIIYSTELEELDDELASIIQAADAKLYRDSKKSGNNVKNGRVDVGFKVDGVDMSIDDIVIQVHITESVGMSVADKIVVGNQLKATIGRYWSDEQTTEDGQKFDLLFSAQSVDNRIVLDIEKIGTTNTLLIELTKRFIESYDK